MTTTVCIAARQPKIEPLNTVSIFEPETHTFNIIYGLRRRNGSRRTTAAYTCTHTHINIYIYMHTHYVRSGQTNNRGYNMGVPKTHAEPHIPHIPDVYNNAQLVFEGSSSLFAATLQLPNRRTSIVHITPICIRTHAHTRTLNAVHT